MSGAEKNNQTPAEQPDVRSEAEGGPQPKKGPRAPNLSTKNTMFTETQERQLAPQNDYEPRREEMTIEKPKLVLNVTAQEFVPGKPRHVLSVNAEAFVPKGQQMPAVDYAPTYQLHEGDPIPVEEFGNMTVCDPTYMGNDAPPYDGTSNAEYEIILKFREVLYTLTLSPGNMEEYLKPLCELIEDTAVSPYLAKSLCDLLLQQSIHEENFRYTGARLCQFLNNNLTHNKHVTGFAKLFITRCGEEFNRRNELLHGSDEDKKSLCGLAIFMAELFLNVETKSLDGTRTRFQFMPAKLAEMIMTLLSVPKNMTVKCVCQLLKLVGGLMEDCAKSDENMDGSFTTVFDELKNLSESRTISQNIQFLVRGVLELRQKNWNRSTTSPPKKEEPVKPAEVTFQQEPVFYHNGKECSRDEVDLPYVLTDEEELAFLEWQAEQEGSTDPWDDPGYESYQLNVDAAEQWMGDDLEAAYEEFLQGQGQTYSGSSGVNETTSFPQGQGQIYGGGQGANERAGFSQASYSGGHGANETPGFQRQVNAAIPPHNQYALQHQSEELMYANDGNHRYFYQQSYNGDLSTAEWMNHMHYPPQSQQPYHAQQMQQQQQQQQQQPYDQSYPHHPPHSSYHPHR